MGGEGCIIFGGGVATVLVFYWRTFADVIVYICFLKLAYEFILAKHELTSKVERAF